MDIKRTKIFITGSTGILGRYLLRLFLLRKDVELVLLIRGNTLEISRARYKRIRQDLLKNEKAFAKVCIVSGDITKKNLGLEENVYKDLCKSLNEIYHCAALVGYNEPYRKVWLVNYIGTKNILSLAQECKSLRKLNYVSTAFIVGNGCGEFKEEDLNINQGFNSPYEKSKFETELLIKKYYNEKYSIAIFRPSIIVGAYSNYKANSFQMFYRYIRTLSLNLFKELPLNFKSVISIIPCDLAAEAMYVLSQNLNKNDTYHIFGNQNFSILRISNLASKYIGFGRPRFINVDEYSFNQLPLFKRKLVRIYLPFLNFKAIFKSNKTIKQLKKLGFVFPKFDNHFIFRLLDYAIDQKFIFKGRN